MKTAPKLALLSTLYFSQGLPFGFFIQALPVLMRERGLDLTSIGLANLLVLPWALKFLWAPAVDRVRRTRVIVPLQAATIALLLALAAADPGTAGAFAPVLAGVLAINMLAATQDIATDGLAVDLLAPAERGLGNGIQVAGYRVGMILGGGALLIAFEHVGWAGTFVAMAAMLALATIPIALRRETEPERGRASAPQGPRRGFAEFVSRPGAWRWLSLLVAYKAGDALATGMLKTFMVDLGMTMGDVGRVLGIAGFLAGMSGALFGGWLAQRAGRRNALIASGILQSLAVLLYVFPATDAPVSTLWGIAAFEHFTGGMATAALFTAMMDMCRPDRAATDYTVQACAVVVATGLAQSASGALADGVGYAAHFAIAAALSLSGTLFVLRHPARESQFALAGAGAAGGRP